MNSKNEEQCLTALDIDEVHLQELLTQWVESLGYKPKHVLLLPPDYTRYHSWAGPITAILYELLSPECQVDIMPALGTHESMTGNELRQMFGTRIPSGAFIRHDWRKSLQSLGEIPDELIRELSNGRLDYDVQVEVNRRIMLERYDLIVSIGQVVPHEVVGMANQNKNIFVGCGGKDMIDKSHFLGAVCGIERILGRADTPVRRLFNEAENRYLGHLPLHYILTVTSINPSEKKLRGLFISQGRTAFSKAAQLSQRTNLTLLKEPLMKVVVHLSPNHFRSTWLGNKAIYRSRMAIADGGELVIIGPGIERFGEDPAINRLIQKYGYSGTDRILTLVSEEKDLRDNLSAAAHLIHGSSEGRFTVTYAPGRLGREEIVQVGYRYLAVDDAMQRYQPWCLKPGFNTLKNGETIYYIGDPALGLWALQDRFERGGRDEPGF